MALDTFVGGLIGAFFNKARELIAGIVGRCMTALGVTWTTTHFALPNFVSWIQQHANGVAGDVIAVLAYINFDKCITMILSAYVVKKAAKLVFSPLSAVTGSSGGGPTT